MSTKKERKNEYKTEQNIKRDNFINIINLELKVRKITNIHKRPKEF